MAMPLRHVVLGALMGLMASYVDGSWAHARNDASKAHASTTGTAGTGADVAVEVALYSDRMRYAFRTAASFASESASIVAELLQPDGQVVSGFAVVDAETTLDLGSTVLAEVWFGGQDTRVVPGSVIALASPWHAPLRIEVPLFAADFDPEARSIRGLVEANADIELDFDLCTDEWTCHAISTTVASDAGGAFELALDPWLGAADVGTLDGHARFQADATTTITQRFAHLGATVEPGRTSFGGPITAGGVVSATARSPGISTGRVTIDMDGNWSVQLGRAMTADSQFGLLYRNPTLGVEYAFETPRASLAAEIDAGAVDVRADRAHAGDTVRLVARSQSQPDVERTLTLDTLGEARYDVASLGMSGGPLEFVHTLVQDGILVRRRAYASGVRVQLGTHFLSGYFGDASSAISLTLRSSDGALEADHQKVAQARRYFSGHFEGVQFDPGDRIEFDQGDGDPSVDVLSAVHARFEREGSVLVGHAPPTKRVRVTVVGGRLDGPIALDAIPDASGRLALPLAEHALPGYPLHGTVEVAESGLLTSVTTWAEPWVEYDVAGQSVFYSRATGRPYHVAVEGAQGGRAEIADDHVWSALAWLGTLPIQRGRFWFGDRSDHAELLVPGSSIVVSGNEATHRWTVPSVRWRTEGRRITVTTSMPLVGASLCTSSTPWRDAWCADAVLAEPDMAVVELPDEAQLVDGLHVRLVGVDQTVNDRLVLPRIEAEIELGDVSVSGFSDAPPNAVVEVVRASGGLERMPAWAEGRRLRTRVPGGLQAQDVVRVVDGAGEVIVSARVPDLVVEGVDGARVVGHAEQPSVGMVQVFGAPLFSQQAHDVRRLPGQVVAIPNADGSFDARLIPAHDLAIAASVRAVGVTRDGHRFTTRHVTPALYVEANGGIVCGYSGAAGGDVQLVHDRAGKRTVEAVTSDRLGAFRTELGAISPITAGDRVTMTSGATAISAHVPPIAITRRINHRATPFFPARQVYDTFGGRGPERVAYYVFYESNVCSVIEPVTYYAESNTQGGGSFGRSDARAAAGRTHTVVLDTAHRGARILRDYVWWGARIDPERAVVDLVMSSWNTAAVSIQDAAGMERARQALRTEDGTRASAALTEAGPLLPGESVSLTLDGDTITEVVPRLSFDWSRGSSVVGVSDRPSDTRVEVALADGSHHGLEPVWTPEGVLRVPAEQIAAVEAAEGAEAMGIRLTLTASPAVSWVVETASSGGGSTDPDPTPGATAAPDPTPSPRERTFLPIGLRR